LNRLSFHYLELVEEQMLLVLVVLEGKVELDVEEAEAVPELLVVVVAMEVMV
jgi:hypothetical protein